MAFLLRSQRAELHHMLQKAGLAPTDFEIVPSTAKALSHEKGEQIRPRGTEYYFSIYPNYSDYNFEKFFVEFSPARDTIHELELCMGWGSVTSAFERYLGYLWRELSTSDPWADSKEFNAAVHTLPSTSTSNDPISPEEREKIVETLGRIETALLEHVAKTEKRDEVRAKKEQFIADNLSAIHTALTTFGKKDFLNLAYSGIIGVATAVGVSPSTGVQVLHLLQQLSSHILPLLAST